MSRLTTAQRAALEAALTYGHVDELKPGEPHRDGEAGAASSTISVLFRRGLLSIDGCPDGRWLVRAGSRARARLTDAGAALLIEPPATRAEIDRVAAWSGVETDDLERAVRGKEARARS